MGQLTPALALLLVHDLLLAKHGIAAPATHPLREAVTRHKVRLHGELTKARLRRGLVSIEDLRQYVNQQAGSVYEVRGNIATGTADVQGETPSRWSHPRWVRINTLRTSLDAELEATFATYTCVDSLEQILQAGNDQHLYYMDQNIPNLLAVSSNRNLLNTPAYKNGLLILQDKASCFPAYLLDPRPDEADIVDACAAPGNKTTHLAALLHGQMKTRPDYKIWACERDKARALTLKNMIDKAGAHDIVKVKLGQDFLQINPREPPWNRVVSLLLDPSCSGSGIIGRDDVSFVALPIKVVDGQKRSYRSAKRKRISKSELESSPDDIKYEDENSIGGSNGEMLNNRLLALSAFQLRLLQHALSFPAARKITYSTCSLHAAENEHVVLKALTSSVSRQRGWRILKREEQVAGARAWRIRGDRDACQDVNLDEDDWPGYGDDFRATVAESCIRCEKGTREGTQGFFVAGFIRDECMDPTNSERKAFIADAEAQSRVVDDHVEEGNHVWEDEWEGFSDK